MRTRRGEIARRGLAALALASLVPAHGAAQAKLFQSDSVLPVTLRTDLRTLLGDRDTTRQGVRRDATLSYAESAGPVGVPGVGHLSSYQAALLGVFQYFIGNTDWWMPRRHNIAVLTVEDSTYAVPFDFDLSGAVDAPYAKPLRVLERDCPH